MTALEREMALYLIDWQIDVAEPRSGTHGGRLAEIIDKFDETGALAPEEKSDLAGFLTEALRQLNSEFPFDASEIIKAIFRLAESTDLEADFWEEAASVVYDPEISRYPGYEAFHKIAYSNYEKKSL